MRQRIAPRDRRGEPDFHRCGCRRSATVAVPWAEVTAGPSHRDSDHRHRDFIPQRRDEIRPEARGIVLAWIERDPADRWICAERIRKPSSDQRGLSETSGGDDDREFPRGPRGALASTLIARPPMSSTKCVHQRRTHDPDRGSGDREQHHRRQHNNHDAVHHRIMRAHAEEQAGKRRPGD